MIDLSQFEHITATDLKVRQMTDDSGDYTVRTYDIFAHHPWGDRSIVYGLENPHDAMLFATAPAMIDEIRALRAEVAELKHRILAASDRLTPPSGGLI